MERSEEEFDREKGEQVGKDKETAGGGRGGK